MRIFDINNTEIKNPDLSRGYLQDDKIFVRHHKAVEPVDEQWHYEVVAKYANGGKDVEKIIDVARVEARAEWDEYEYIQRYIEYTDEDVSEETNPLNINHRLDKIEETLLMLTQFLDSHKENYMN